MYRHLMATVGIVTAVGVAHAQQMTTGTAGPALVEVENEAMVAGALNMTVDQLEDMEIHGAGGERIGEVDEVLMNAQGAIVAVAAEVGGFLGIGDKEVAIPLDRLRREGGSLQTDLTREQIEALPGWDD